MLIDSLFVKLREKLNEELRVQKQVLGVVGMMDSLMAAQSNGTVSADASG
jgi:NH3-dependent NAD+ synthetase